LGALCLCHRILVVLFDFSCALLPMVSSPFASP
jgi:hypothetical protein